MVALLIASGLFSYHYAGVMAEIGLSDELPPAWEQKNIEVIVTIASMNKVQEQGEQFRFYVEQTLTPDAVVPSHILLNYFHGNQWNRKAKISEANATEKPPILKVGERWQLKIRLKRPHATYNPPMVTTMKRGCLLIISVQWELCETRESCKKSRLCLAASIHP